MPRSTAATLARRSNSFGRSIVVRIRTYLCICAFTSSSRRFLRNSPQTRCFIRLRRGPCRDLNCLFPIRAHPWSPQSTLHYCLSASPILSFSLSPHRLHLHVPSCNSWIALNFNDLSIYIGFQIPIAIPIAIATRLPVTLSPLRPLPCRGRGYAAPTHPLPSFCFATPCGRL